MNRNARNVPAYVFPEFTPPENINNLDLDKMNCRCFGNASTSSTFFMPIFYHIRGETSHNTAEIAHSHSLGHHNSTSLATT